MSRQTPDPTSTTDANTAEPAKSPGDVLARRNGESARAHRAMLLWLMQDDDRRSVRAAARAVGRSESTAREWRNRWAWNDRRDVVGMLAAVKAATVYRARYYAEYRLREVVEIEDRMAAPFTPDAPIPQSVADAVRAAVRPDATTDAEAERRKRTRRAHVSLVDGALGLIAKRITAGDVRVSLRDIPVWRQRRQEIAGMGEGGTAKANGSLPPIESVRVRHARTTGGDVVAAMHDDALELCAILGAIRAASSVPPDALAVFKSTTDAGTA